MPKALRVGSFRLPYSHSPPAADHHGRAWPTGDERSNVDIRIGHGYDLHRLTDALPRQPEHQCIEL
ncbi:MAG TPA: hypothetical protein PKU91_08190, partial [Phycisphaerales bacterium]|nr:hypothetical protein [Phycisphaerales bacterium]